MKSFAALLYEAIEIRKLDFFDGPISSNVRNVNIARAELADNLEHSKGDDRTEYSTHYRALYDVKSKKFWVWYAVDGLHGGVIKYLKKNNDNMVHLEYKVGEYVTAPSRGKLKAGDRVPFEKFFGKQVNFIDAYNQPFFIKSIR